MKHATSSDTAHLGLAFLLNLGFTLLELLGGIWTNSVVVLSDAAHDLGDCLSLALAWHLAWHACSSHWFSLAAGTLLGGAFHHHPGPVTP